MPRLQKGDILKSIPSKDWNSFHDTNKTVAEMQRGGNGTGQSANNSAALEIYIKNDTGEDLTSEYPILQTTDAAYALEKMKRKRIALNGDAPIEGTGPFVIVQSPLKANRIGTAAIHGYSLCYIDVSDEDHTRATEEDDNVDNLISTDSGGVRIVDKESGTGIKLAIVDLGGGSGGGATIGSLPEDDVLPDIDNEIENEEGGTGLGDLLALVKGTVPGSSGAACGLLSVGSSAGAFLVYLNGDPIMNNADPPEQIKLPVANPDEHSFIGGATGILTAGFLSRHPNGTVYFVLPRVNEKSRSGWVDENNQSLGHDEDGLAEWQDDDECEE